MPDDAIRRLLDARGRTHGDFADHARATQRLKGVMNDELGRRHTRGQPDLSLCALETLDMIMHKLGRIIAGRWDHPDHWNDLAGYARLVAESVGALPRPEVGAGLRPEGSGASPGAPKSPLGDEFSASRPDK